jgi:hypothetical protein
MRHSAAASGAAHVAHSVSGTHRAPALKKTFKEIISYAVAAFVAVVVLAGSTGYAVFSHQRTTALAACQQAVEQLLDANDAVGVAQQRAAALTSSQTSSLSNSEEYAAWQTLQRQAPEAASVPECPAVVAGKVHGVTVDSIKADAQTLNDYAKKLREATQGVAQKVQSQQIAMKLHQ